MEINAVRGFFAELLMNPYIRAAIIFIIFFVLAKAIIVILERKLKSITSKTKTKIDDMIVEKVGPPTEYLIYAVALRFVFEHFEVNNRVIEKSIDSAIAVLAIYFFIVLITTLVDIWSRRLAAKKQSKMDTLSPLIHNSIKVIFFIAGIVIVLNVWEKDVTGIFAGLGIAGIVLGFALKDTLGNIFGGISIILDKTYRIGDRIKVDSGENGIVYDISLRSTKIKTWDNDIIIIPNGKMADARIQNYVLPNLRSRCVLSFGVAYGSDVEKVKKVAIDTIKKIDNVLKEPEPSVVFTKMSDFSLDFDARFWVESISERYLTTEKARCMIYKAFKKAKISIPFPTRTVYIKKNK